jgi:hypothetical protein
MSKKHDDDMISFRLGIDRERWQQFTQACNQASGRALEPCEVEQKAFDMWRSSIDAVIKHYGTDDTQDSSITIGSIEYAEE